MCETSDLQRGGECRRSPQRNHPDNRHDAFACLRDRTESRHRLANRYSRGLSSPRPATDAA